MRYSLSTQYRISFKRSSSFIAVFFLMFVGSSFAEDGVIKVGVDTLGVHKVTMGTDSANADVATAISLSMDFMPLHNDFIGFGYGLTLQAPRSQEDYKGDFFFWPVYLLLRGHLPPRSVRPYVVGHVGYNLLFGGDDDYRGYATLKGGPYYGAGAGIILKEKLQLEALYSINAGTVEIDEYKFDIEYSKATFSLGFIF